MANEVKIKVTQVKEVKTRDGRTFMAYRCLSPKSKKQIDLKFRREVRNLPESPCYIYVDAADVNITTAGEYPVAWVKAVNRIAPLHDPDVTNAEEFFDLAEAEEVF